ncbi:MAG: hypothetical protein DCC49_12010 [Acidobacteria bacterium]|nr:MAG: hypothetical protein DCC49_12010 [Acidobacteriota bacterium]
MAGIGIYRIRLAFVFVVALVVGIGTAPGAIAKSPKHGAGLLPPPPAPGATRYFEPNVGQFEDQVRFVTNAGSYRVNFYDDGFDLESVVPKDDKGRGAKKDLCDVENLVTCLEAAPKLKSVTTKVRFDQASATPVGHDVTGGVANYYMSSGVFTGVERFSSITYPGLYGGIDLVFRYNENANLEFDLHVSEGIDPARFGLKALGDSEIEIDGAGDLLIRGTAGIYKKSAPIVIPSDASTPPPAEFFLDHNVARIRLLGPAPSGDYVIDPAITYSSYYTGTLWDGDVRSIRGADGSVYVAGVAMLTEGDFALAISKRATPGAEPWDTYVDGSGFEAGLGIAISPNGKQIGVVGITNSGDLPLDPDLTGAQIWDNTLNGNQDAVVLRLTSGDQGTPRGEVNFASYYGGNDGPCDQTITLACLSEGSQGIAFDPTENVSGPLGPGSLLIAGFTNAETGMPSGIQSGYQSAYGGPVGSGRRDAFFAKLNPDFSGPVANRLRWSSYFGGQGDEYIDIQLGADSSGNYWISGMSNGSVPTTDGTSNSSGTYDIFAARFAHNSGNVLENSTMLSGDGFDLPADLDVQGDFATIAAETTSSNLLTTPGAAQSGYAGTSGTKSAYVAQLRANTGGVTTQTYGSYIGGPGDTFGRAIGVTGSVGSSGQRIFVAGGTSDVGFPVSGAISGKVCGSAGTDPFFVAIDTSAGLPNAVISSSCVGGSENDNAEDLIVYGAYGSESVILTGPTDSSDYPTERGSTWPDPPTLSPYVSAPAVGAGAAGFVTIVDPSPAVRTPDYIAFESNRKDISDVIGSGGDENNYSIWKMAEDGSGLAPVTPIDGAGFAGQDRQPSISPNGRRIAYVSNRNPEGQYDLYVVDKSGPAYYSCRLTNDSAEERRPAWSKDGNSIAFSSDLGGSRELYLASFYQGATTCPTYLAPNQITWFGLSSGLVPDSPSFSPDSGCIAFTLQNTQTPVLITDIYVMRNPSTGICPVELTQLTTDGAFNAFPSWSIATPGHCDGRIAFASARDSAPDPQIWVIEHPLGTAGCSGLAPSITGPLTTAPGQWTGSSTPDWSPDGSSLVAYASIATGDADIWSMEDDGAGQANLIDTNYGPDLTTTDWWPSFGAGAG